MCVPITDGDQKVFRSGREKLKISDVHLLHLDGLTELDNKPEHQREGLKQDLRHEKEL